MESDKIIDRQGKIEKLEDEQLKVAQSGWQLEESQNKLQEELDKCSNEMMAMTQNYEKEKYNLLKEVELKKQMIKYLRSQLDIMKQDIMNLEKLSEELSGSDGSEANELKT